MKKISNFLTSKYTYILSFLITFGILVILAWEERIYPFGDSTYLYGDAYQQYLTFLQNMKIRILNGEGFNYAWDAGLGSGYRALYAYYLASPANWLVMLVSPVRIIDMVDLIILIKLPLCAVTFTHYLTKKYGKTSLLTTAVSICYALCAYMCNYGHVIIWLDSLILFPLIILGIEKLYEEKKYKLYFFSLFAAILSNYYIGIIICIYLAIYFAALVLFNEKKLPVSDIFRRIKTFAVYSLLAGTATFAVTLPAVFALSGTASGDFSFPKSIKFYISIQDMMIRPLILAPKDTADLFPNLYCSVIVLLIIPAFILNGKIQIKTKVKYILLTLFMLVSFNCNVLDYIWHGFHFPNQYVARNSFIYVFLVLTVAYEGLLNIKELKDKFYIICILIPIAYVGYLWKFQINNPDATTTYKENIVYLSLFFLVVYIFLVTMLRGLKGMRKQTAVYFLILCTVSYEVYMNAGVIDLNTYKRSDEIKEYNKTSDSLSKLHSNQTSFFRIESDSGIPINWSTGFGYGSASMFSSTTNQNIVALYKVFGLSSDTNGYVNLGIFPIVNSLLNVKYVTNYTTKSGLRSSENIYNFSLGFMTNKSFENSIDMDETNPFNNFNNMFKALSGKSEDLYKFVQTNKEDKTNISFTANTEGIYYLALSKSCQAIMITITRPDGTPEAQLLPDIPASFILTDTFEPGTTVKVTNLDSTDFEIYAATCNNDLMKYCYDNLKDGFLSIDNIDGDGVSGTIDAGDGGIMFTSIPADKGWTAYVDGKEVSIHAFKDAFISLELDAGEHEIVLRYKTPGGTSGVVISILALFSFIIIELHKYHKKELNMLLSRG